MGASFSTGQSAPRSVRSNLLCGLLFLTGLLVSTATNASAVTRPGGAPGTSHKESGALKLEPGKPVKREMSGSQSHSYEVMLRVGEFINIVVEQRGIDVVVTVFSPGGKKVIEVDSPNEAQGPEPVFLVAEEAGAYRLEVRSLNKGAPVGMYEARIEELREAKPEDITRVAAEMLMDEADYIYFERPPAERRNAIEKYEQALALMRSIGNRGREIDALNGMGLVYRSIGETQKAISSYDEAVSLSRAIGDGFRETSGLTGKGIVYRATGEHQKALEVFNLALTIARTRGDLASQAVVLNNLGPLYRSLGENQKALDQYHQALPIDRALGNRAAEAVTLNNIGLIYSIIGENQRALDYYNQALPILKAAEDREAIATTLLNIGSIYLVVKEYQKALDHLDQALPMMREVGERQGEAVTLNNMGLVHHALGENEKALGYFDQAFSISKSLSHRVGEAATLMNMGKVYHSLGENDKALDHYNQALPITKAIGDRVRESMALFGMGRAERALGQLSQARAHVEASLGLVESLRLNVAGAGFRSTFTASAQPFYEFYIDLLMQMHKLDPAAGYDRAAFKTAEMARARALLETLIEGRADIRKGVDSALLDRERSLQSALNNRIERRVRLLSGRHTNEQAVQATKEVEALISEYQEVQSQIRAKSPQYAALSQPTPLSLEEVQQQVLDSDTLLLEYSLGEDRSYLWAVTKSSLSSFELPKRDEIEAAARRLYALLTERNRTVRFETPDERRARIASADAGSRKALAELSRMVLGPVSSMLTKKRLLIVSDGALQYLPFAALHKPGRVAGQATSQRFLVLDHEIVSLPSASTLAVLRRELAGRSPAANAVAVLADPVFEKDDPRVAAGGGNRVQTKLTGESPARPQPEATAPGSELVRSLRDSAIVNEIGRIQRLPFTRMEAKAISRYLKGNEMLEALDFDASRVTAMSPEMASYKYIHFATHAVFNSYHPELSGIVLSLVDKLGREQDGFLKAHDIYNMKFGADLAVLSSCRTALGKEVKGEGLVSLTRGFMYAGVARVLASLWNVSDEPTAQLMTDFYKGLLGRRAMSPAAAIRGAQVRMLQGKRWHPPYYWAGFVLQGEPL